MNTVSMSSRISACILAIVGSAATGLAQDIDALPEGTTATVLALTGVTLQDLDTGLGTAPDPFYIDDASGGVLQLDYGYGGPNNVVSFGAFLPGPNNLYGPVKSFRMLFSPATPAAFFNVWISRADAGNTVQLDYLSQGVIQDSTTLTIPPGTAPFWVHLNPTVSPGGLDEIVVTGSGPHNGGVFHAVIDGFLLGAIVDFAQTCDGMPGASVPCPCGNDSTPFDPEGCAHSLGYGARLRLIGEPIVSNDTLQLVCMQLPPSAPALFFQGTQFLGGSASVVFGDGTRCAGGSIVRIATKIAVSGTATYPGPGDAPVSVQGQIPGSTQRTYQVWYRNAASFCTPSTFNLSNASRAFWSP